MFAHLYAGTCARRDVNSSTPSDTHLFKAKGTRRKGEKKDQHACLVILYAKNSPLPERTIQLQVTRAFKAVAHVKSQSAMLSETENQFALQMAG